MNGFVYRTSPRPLNRCGTTCSNSPHLRLPRMSWRYRHVVKTGVFIVICNINQTSNQLVVSGFLLCWDKFFIVGIYSPLCVLPNIELYTCKHSSCRCVFIIDNLKNNCLIIKPTHWYITVKQFIWLTFTGSRSTCSDTMPHASDCKCSVGKIILRRNGANGMKPI